MNELFEHTKTLNNELFEQTKTLLNETRYSCKVEVTKLRLYSHLTLMCISGSVVVYLYSVYNLRHGPRYLQTRLWCPL